MSDNRHEVPEQLQEMLLSPHPEFPHLFTCEHLNNCSGDYAITLPNLQIQIHGIDYLKYAPDISGSVNPDLSEPLRFQQDYYRLWYQIEGQGILQNVTGKSFGTARPGLLGVMEKGERHTYLHQKGNFSCFQLLFSLHSSNSAKCFWSAQIEGKTVLEGGERTAFDAGINDLLNRISQNRDPFRLFSLSRLADMLVTLFDKDLIIIEDSRFPRNKAKILAAKAKNYMDSHYMGMHHQRDIENEFGIDINYLNILFKKEYGKTLYKYMTEMRLEHAKHLLETSTDTITDIALHIGYPNANSFSRAFKRCERKTPQQYRDDNRCVVNIN